ncbi:hypothetical protein [Vibrio quintilis]|uniref:Uncharacterized protein n=1 Tax=Vibrio quintilis TaxID=1117707 RepID=A0A1M7Z2X8_9VIBR|nr:hypothetical protein [Vibrio quintilis]SHO59241.1 hypothetical protein VQ7734_05021 [Vibrio quintilis]
MDINKKEFILEPALFIDCDKYMSGAKKIITNIEVIDDQHLALQLLFEQEVPNGYGIWSDFFSDLVSSIILDKNYKFFQEEITNEVRLIKGNNSKNSIRERMKYLKLKKQGLIKDESYREFLDEISDECSYMLSMISLNRYINDFVEDSIFEKIFEIFKSGMIPCGINKDNKIVVFNPSLMK